MGEEEEEEKKAATTQFDIVRSDSFLRDGGLLPRPGLGLQPQPKVFAGDLPSLGFIEGLTGLSFPDYQ